MKFLLQLRPVLQRYLVKSDDEPVEKITSFPSQIGMIKDPVMEQRAFMDVSRDPTMEYDQDIEHTAIDFLDMTAVMGKLEVRVEAGVAEVFENGAFVIIIEGNETGYR
jgi:hypothetical protein